MFIDLLFGVRMTDNTNWESLQKSVPDADNSEAKARFLQKQNEIKKRFEAKIITSDNVEKEISFFHERYTANLQSENEAITSRAYSPTVRVPLLSRLYQGMKGLINNGLKGAAYGFKNQARTDAAPENKAHIDFQQIKDELAYFKQTQLPQEITDKENQAWNKVSNFVKRKESENEKWGINPDKFEIDLGKNLKTFVQKVREEEFISQELVDQGMIKNNDIPSLSKENIKRNKGISTNVNNLIDFFKKNNSFRKDKNTTDQALTSQMGNFMDKTEDKKMPLSTEKASPILNNFVEQHKKSEKNEAPLPNKVVNKNKTKPSL